MTTLGAIFPPDLPPERLHAVALAADRAGLEELWLWEDCFRESGIAPAAAVLAWTQRLTVGIGLLPVPLRNVALTAMEIATLQRMFPGRIVPGIGHGVLDWMAQVGERVESPMALLREYTVALRALLHGETVTTSGRYVQLDRVTLDWPCEPPPLLVGAIKPRTAALAGELADGIILTGATTPEQLRETVGHYAGVGRVVVFVAVDAADGAEAVAARVRQFTEAGATSAILLSVGDQPALVEFVQFVAQDVRALVD